MEDTVLLEGIKGSQVMGSKHKKGTSINEKEYRPLKKAKEKYYKDDMVKIGGTNPCEQCMCARQDYLVYHSK